MPSVTHPLRGSKDLATLVVHRHGHDLGRAQRGGIENVFVRDIEIGEVGSAIDIDLLYDCLLYTSRCV